MRVHQKYKKRASRRLFAVAFLFLNGNNINNVTVSGVCLNGSPGCTKEVCRKHRSDVDIPTCTCAVHDETYYPAYGDWSDLLHDVRYPHRDGMIFSICDEAILDASSEKITVSCDGDTIECHGCSINGGGTQMLVTAKDVTIRGIGMKGAASTAVKVLSGGEVTMEDLMFEDCNEGVYVGFESELSVKSCVFRGQETRAISNHGKLDIDNVKFDESSSPFLGSSVASFDGGSISISLSYFVPKKKEVGGPLILVTSSLDTSSTDLKYDMTQCGGIWETEKGCTRDFSESNRELILNYFYENNHEMSTEKYDARSISPRIECQDDPDYRYKNKNKKSCIWVKRKPSKRCNKKWRKGNVQDNCRATCAKCDDFPVDTDPVTFYVTGDYPYESKTVPILEDHVTALSDDAAFFVHVGDLKSGFKRDECTVTYFDKIATIFKKAAIPILALVGDNDWVDCENPDDALVAFHEVLVPIDQSREDSLGMIRQTKRRENFAFFMRGVLFISVNVIGVPKFDPINEVEWQNRHNDNVAWVRTHFEDFGRAIRATVVFSHAHPLSSRDNAFYDQFVLDAEALGAPLLYIHGNDHKWRMDMPFDVDYMMRVTVEPGKEEFPLRVTVGEENEDMFQLKRG